MKKEILQLFPESVLRINLDIKEKERLSIIKHIKKYSYGTIATKTQVPCSDGSENRYIFSEPIFKNLKNLILKEFHSYVENHFKYFNKFVFTTSWTTRSKPGDASQFHNHNNCMFSGVYYPEVHKETDYIIFRDYVYGGQFMCKPKEHNLYNSEELNIGLKNNDMIIFPSYMMHSIPHNLTKETRYSIAFNLIPTGYVGYTDSALELYYDES